MAKQKTPQKSMSELLSDVRAALPYYWRQTDESLGAWHGVDAESMAEAILTKQLAPIIKSAQQQVKMRTLLSSTNMHWGTPWDLFTPLDNFFGFYGDAFASVQNKKRPIYFSADPDDKEALGHDVFKNSLRPPKDSPRRGWFANPEYGDMLPRALGKMRYEAMDWGGPCVNLVPNRPGCGWWAAMVTNAGEVGDESTKRGKAQAKLNKSLGFEGAGAFIGSYADKNGGRFKDVVPCEEWRCYQWERLTVEAVNLLGRVPFVRPEGNSGGAPFPSALIIYTSQYGYEQDMRRAA